MSLLVKYFKYALIFLAISRHEMCSLVQEKLINIYNLPSIFKNGFQPITGL